MIGGILRPPRHRGRRGRIAALLELGAGFHPEPTGRENVYLNASILGLTVAETDERFDAIVEFPGIGDFIDTQVKFYSSGMYVRLAFAVAVHVDPDILLVDEVLAVGDEAFQRKCMDRIQEFRRGPHHRFVSVTRTSGGNLCDRAIVLQNGELVFDGDNAATGTELLRDQLRGARLDAPTRPSPVQPTAVSFHAEDGPRMHFQPGETLTVVVELEVAGEQAQQIELQAVVVGAQELPIWVMSALGTLTVAPGSCSIDFVVPSLPELQGAFAVRVEISDPKTGRLQATCRFPDIFSVNGRQPAGRSHTPYDVRTVE